MTSNVVPAFISLAVGIAFASISLISLSHTAQSQTPEKVDIYNPYVAYPCQNVIVNTNSSGTFYTCPHTSEIANVVFSLPAPTYKKVACTSTYGCSRPYNYKDIVPSDLLSEDEKQIVIAKMMNLPEMKLNSGWQLDHFIIQPREDRWIANVQFFIAGIKQLPPSQECGWYGSVDIDLETLEILGVNDIPPRSDVKCDGASRVELTINGLKETYRVGEIIDVSATQKGGGCGMPEIVIRDENQQTVLVSKIEGDILCPVLPGHDQAEFSMTWTPSYHGSPIVINQTGTYTLAAEFELRRVEQQFTVTE